MKTLRSAVMLLAILVLVLPSSAAIWTPFDGGLEGEPSVSVRSSGLSGVSLSIDVPGVVLNEVAAAGGDYVLPSLPSYGHTTVVGEARLPVIREFIEIPFGAEVAARVAGTEEADAIDLGAPVLPVQEPVEKVPGARERARFARTEAYYARDSFGPDEIVRVGEPRIMRGHRYVMLEVTPLRYNPAAGLIRPLKRIDIEIDFVGGDLVETRRMTDRYSTGPAVDVAEHTFINYDAFRSRYDIPLPIGYLIVVYDSFYDQILPLAEWREQKGYDTTVVRTSDIPGGNTKENIKSYIEDAYDTWAVPPTFVLLVGDTPYIENWTGTQTNNPPTDLYYVTMDGSSDWDPDIWIGRFSCTSTAQVTNLVSKTVDYERYNLSSGTGWIRDAVFMAGDDNYALTEGTHNYVISTYFNPAGYTCEKLYEVTYGATTSDVADAFDDGRSWGIYSGHGDTGYWADGPQFTASNVNSLTNSDMLPLIHSYSCLTGEYDAACFGETWINATDKGALAYWGSSVTSYWDEDDYLEKGAVKAALSEGYTWAGGISHRALYWLYQQYGGLGSTRRYFEMYNLLGDPAVDIWTDVPVTLSVSYPSTVPVGTSAFTVNVTSGGSPVANALVCVTKDDDGVYEAAYTNGAGQAAMTLSPAPVTPGDMDVTVTRHDHYPYEGTAAVSTANSPHCVYQSHVIDDDAVGGSSGNGDGSVDAGETIELKVTLENIGNQPGYGVSATLSESDAYVILTDAVESYGDIPASGTAQCVEDYDFTVDASCPDGHIIEFTLTATDGDSTWISQFGVTVVALELVLDGYSIDDSPGGGNGNGCAEPGETIGLAVTLGNSGGGAATGIAAVLSTTDPYVSLGQTSGSVGSIPGGGTGLLVPDFEVTLLPTVPVNHEVSFDLSITASGGYATSETLVLKTGGGIAEDFEGSGDDWTHYVVTTGFSDQWHVETARSHSSSHSWKFGGSGTADYTDSSDGALEAPPLCIGNAATMSFWHWLDAEEESSTSAWDCALVQISTDGGSNWTVLVPDGGYSHTKNYNTANPVPQDTPCWSGTFTWRQETFDLSAYEGENAIIRFRFASDGSVTEEGWYIDDIEVTNQTSAVDGDPELVPASFALFQNAPNPFNPVTTIRYALAEPGRVTIRVYSVSGALVRTLVDVEKPAGQGSVAWNGRDDAGEKVASGVYLYAMTAGKFNEKRMMVLLK